MWIIGSGGYPHHYLNKYLYVYSLHCESNQVPVINRMDIDLADPLTYHGIEWCVDYVQIKPSPETMFECTKSSQVEDHPPFYCGRCTDTTPHTLNGTNKVEIWFRTSQKDNEYLGFHMHITCSDSPQAEESKVPKYLPFPSWSDKKDQQVNLCV